MKFLCDVHISYRIRKFLQDQGHEALYVNEILQKSETKDSLICKFADENDLIIITKDFDFVGFHQLNRSPKKLIKINLGNISSDELIQILKKALPLIEKVSTRKTFLIELDKGESYIIEENNNS